MIIFSSTSCVIGEGIEGNGNIVKKKFNITESFTAITVSQGIEVILTQAEQASIEAEMDENILPLLVIVVDGKKLKISFKENIRKRTKTIVYVSMPEITALSTSSGGDIESTNKFKVQDITLKSSSGGEIELNLSANSIDCNSSSGGDIELKGECQTLDAEASSGAKIDAEDLHSKIVTANASSGANIDVFASESIDANSSSGADIDCYGNPSKQTISKSSSGSIDFK